MIYYRGDLIRNDPLRSDPQSIDLLPSDPLLSDPPPSDPLRSVCCRPHEARSKLRRQVIINNQTSANLGIVIGFGFGWLTLNRIEFAAKDTRRLLSGRKLGLPLNRESPASIKTSPLDCGARRNVNTQPSATAIGRSKPHASDSRSRDGSSGQKAPGSSSTFGKRRLWESEQVYTRSSTKFSLDPPHV